MGTKCSKSMKGCGKPAAKKPPQTQSDKYTVTEFDKKTYDLTLGQLPDGITFPGYTPPGNYIPRRAAALVLGTVLGFGALVSLGSYGFEMPTLSVGDARSAAVHQGETSTSGSAKKQERQD